MTPLLVISLCLGLALSQSTSGPIEPVYREGNEYIYKYETQVLSGLPMGSKIYSGIKIVATVRFQLTGPTRVNFRIEDPFKIYTINDMINTADPTREMVPTDSFTELIDPDLDRMRTEIFKPCTFSYIRGHITDLVTEDDDPLWSVNIKKGILSFLELNFNERQTLQSLDDPVTVEHSDLMPKFYRVVEPSVTGECETSYWVKPDITHDGQTLMKIEKVRNYNRCIDKVSYFFDMFNGRDCDFCEPYMKFDPFTAQSSVRYNIIGSPSQYLIMNAYTEGQYNFVPYSEKGGRMTTFTNSTMTFVDSRPISTQIPEPSQPMKHEKPIKGDHPEEKKSDHLLSGKQLEIKEIERTENYKMAVKALMAYEKFSRDKIEEETGPVMVELRRLLRTLDKSWLEKLLNEINSNNMRNARKGLMDMLPVIGTFEGVDLIMDRLIKEDPLVTWPPSVFMNLALMPRPDVPTVQRFHDFIVTKKFTDPIHMRAAWLSLGSLGYKMVTMNITEHKEYEKQKDLLKEIKDKSNLKQVHRDMDEKLQKLDEQRLQKIALYNELRRKIVESVMTLMKSPNPDDVILALKTIGNLGYIEFLPEVKVTIWNKELPLLRRMQAVFCTRRILRYFPEKVRPILLPVYLDFKEPEELRIAAYFTFMNTRPPRPDLEIIARTLPNEPSYNVGALVWSHLVALSNRTTTCNCVESLVRNTTLAMRYARKFTWGLQFSNYFYYSGYDRDLQASHAYEHVMLFNSMEKMPRGMAMIYKTAFLGRYMDMMEIGMNGKGLDSYLDKLAKTAGSTSFPDVLTELLKPRKPRSVKPSEQEIHDIKEKLKIKPRVSETMEGHIYFKLFGQELVYMDINPPVKTQDSSPESNSTPKDFPDSPASSVVDSVLNFMKMFRSILYPLRHEMLLTECGLPMFVKLDLAGAWKIETNFRLESSQHPSQALKPKDIVLDFKPSGLFQLWCEMGVDMWYWRSGAVIKPTLYFNSPLSMTFNIDPNKPKLIITFKDEKVLNPFKIEWTPMTFLRHFPPDVKRYPIYPTYKEIMAVDGVELMPFNYEYGKDWFGRIFSVTGKWPVPRLYNVPIFPMTGKFMMFTEYKPINPTGWELHWQHVSGDTDQSEDVQSLKQGWWPFDGWFGDATEKQPQPVSSEELGTSQESSHESDLLESQPIDLKQQDLSIQHLKQKLQKYIKSLKTGTKCGFILRLVECGPNPVHDVQISTLYQRDKPGYEEMYTVEIWRAPIPKLETKPWKMIADIRMTYPEVVVEPSDLLSDHYQHQVFKQIKMAFHGEHQGKETLIDLDTLSLTEAVKHLMKLTQTSNQDIIVEEIMNHLMQNMQSSKSQSMKDLIQDQRQLLKMVRELKKQPIEIKKLTQISQKMKEFMEKCETNVKKLKSLLDEIQQGEQQPEESAISHSVILKVMKTIEELDKIYEKLRPTLPTHEQISIQRKLKDIKELVISVIQKQKEHSISKQSQELNKSQLEVDPEQRSIYRFFLELERQNMQACQSFDQDPENLEPVKPYLEKLLQKSVAARDSLDESLIRDGKLCKMMRVKALEVVFKHRCFCQSLKEKLPQPHSPSVDPTQQKMIMDILKLKQQLKKVSTEISKRISLAVNMEKESTHTTECTKPVQDNMKILQTHAVKQLQIVEKLRYSREKLNKKQIQSSTQQIESPEQEISKVFETVQQIHDSIKQIIEFKESQDSSEASPVIIKTLKVLSKHVLILEKVGQFLKQYRHQTFMSPEQSSLMSQYLQETQMYSPRLSPVQSVSQSSSPEEMKKTIQILEEESLKLLKRITKVLPIQQHSQEQQSLKSSLEQQPSFLQSQPLSPDSPVSQILQKVHHVQAHQLQLESVVQSMIKVLDDQKPEKSKLFQQISDIYQLMSGMSKLQKMQEEVQHDLSVLSDSPISKKLQSVSTQLKDSLKQQKIKMTAFEKKLIKYQQGSSLQLPVQKAQQLKDQIQRLYQDQKSIDKKLKDQVKVKSSRSSSQSSAVPGEYEGLMTIHYGLEGTTMRKILMKIFGKKTLEQLLWEQKQSYLGEQDKLVTDYLSEKQQPNDQLSPSYHKLKNELNVYRRWQILCAYEKEMVDVYFRHYMWRLHEYMKYRFFPKTTFVMPDKTNIPNNFEIVSELRRDMRSMDMDIKTPYETTWFRNLYVPNMCRMFVPPNTVSYGTHILKKLTQDKLPATCEVSDSRVKTLDQHRYAVPQLSVNCKKILSMDCSEDSKYVVMSQPSKHDTTLKDITLLTKHDKIEIVQKPSGPMMKVNDQEIQLHVDSPLSIRHEDGSHVSVEKLDKKVKVSIPHLSLEIYTDGKKTDVKVGQYYYSKVCGLCGNMDSNPSNDYEGPLKVVHPDSSSVSAAYLVPDSQCDAEQIQKQHGVPEIQKQAKMMPPVQQTKVIEKTQGYVRKTCFSTQPVKRCPESSSPEGITSRLISYHCLDSSSPSTQKLVLRSHSHVLDELRYKTVDLNQYESEPKACITQ